MELGKWTLITSPSLLALIPLLLYLIMVFRNKSNLAGLIVATIGAAILTGQNLKALASIFATSLGSFLGIIGLIIMFGSGLGYLMNKTKVSHTLVYWIVKRIGVNNEKKGMYAVITTSIVTCGLLGTLAGGGKAIVMIIASVVGGFGIEAAAVAEINIVNKMFIDLVAQVGLPMEIWATAILAATRITGSMYPTANLAGQLGIARCTNMKAVLKASWIGAAALWIWVIAWSFIY